MVVGWLNRLCWGIPVKLTPLTCTTHHKTHTHGGAYCGVAIIIVVDVHMDLGGGGGGVGHEQDYGSGVSEPRDARCVAVECVWLRVW